ncbi:Metallo-dependent phosphatase-like protein [Collybia nuda]|uniref:Metallo-dependent phosphatase-like protein n=1 Tax=Collybia nuda TaxID=64659 RepID=A0A9P6CIG8_9AGAR|nr:Metallo-dependent phosphatase-like protein [Collybia nuda]
MSIPYAPRTLISPSAHVHLEYDPTDVPPIPSTSADGEPCHWTRFVCVSDTHARTFPVPPGDVLLHSGDLTNTGKVEEFGRTMEWLCGLPHPVKIVIAGNHDLTLHEGWYEQNYSRWGNVMHPRSAVMELLKGPKAVKAGVVYLQDEAHEFSLGNGRRTWSIYGSPWSPEFFNWAFNYKRGEEATKLVSKFPKTDILLTHGPIAGIFDCTRMGDLAGCDDLRARIRDLRPRLHLAGHIHEAHGGHIHTWKEGGGEGLPSVQNTSADEDVETEDVEAASGLDRSQDKETTVFVNAANWPSGSKAWRTKEGGGEAKVPFAGPGFQPVIVDLRD